jgi:hypothetical protein
VHAPQLRMSLVVSTQPVGLVAGHAVSPALQTMPQMLALQLVVPPSATGHTVPQAPQLLVSPVVSRHTALAVLALHNVFMGAQRPTQPASVHALDTPFMGTTQGVQDMPQELSESLLEHPPSQSW